MAARVRAMRMACRHSSESEAMWSSSLMATRDPPGASAWMRTAWPVPTERTRSTRKPSTMAPGSSGARDSRASFDRARVISRRRRRSWCRWPARERSGCRGRRGRRSGSRCWGGSRRGCLHGHARGGRRARRRRRGGGGLGRGRLRLGLRTLTEAGQAGSRVEDKPLQGRLSGRLGRLRHRPRSRGLGLRACQLRCPERCSEDGQAGRQQAQ